MFRVLTEEESRTVKRWQAPSLSSADKSISLVTESPVDHVPGMTNESDTIGVPDELFGEFDARPGSREEIAAADLNPVEPAPRVNDARPNNSGIEGMSKKEEATSVSAEMLQSSYDEGYAKGYSDGNIAVQETDNAKLAGLLESLRHQKTIHDEQLLEDLVDMVKSVAGLVIRREILADASILRDWIVEGLNRLPTVVEPPAVRLHPLDAASVKLLLDTSFSDWVIEDMLVNRGECRIESGSSIVRIGVHEQIDRLVASVPESDSEPS